MNDAFLGHFHRTDIPCKSLVLPFNHIQYIINHIHKHLIFQFTDTQTYQKKCHNTVVSMQTPGVNVEL